MNPDQTLIPIAQFRLRRLTISDLDYPSPGDIHVYYRSYARLEQLHRTPTGHDVWLPIQLEGFDAAH